MTIVTSNGIVFICSYRLTLLPGRMLIRSAILLASGHLLVVRSRELRWLLIKFYTRGRLVHDVAFGRPGRRSQLPYTEVAVCSWICDIFNRSM